MTPTQWASLTDAERAAYVARYGPPPVGYLPATTRVEDRPATVLRGDRNGMGTAGLVFGILGLVFSIIPIIGVVSWFLWPFGVVFGAAGMSRAKRGEATNRGVATGGLVTALAAAAICLLWAFGLGASASKPAAGASVAAGAGAQASPAAVKPAVPATVVGDGTYQVGTDMAAGRYKTAGPAGNGDLDVCYWQRAKDDSGDFKSLISNDLFKGPGSVTVKSGEFVKLTGGCEWRKQ